MLGVEINQMKFNRLWYGVVFTSILLIQSQDAVAITCVVTGAGNIVCGKQIQIVYDIHENETEETKGMEWRLCKPGDATCDQKQNGVSALEKAMETYGNELEQNNGYHDCMDNGGYHDDCSHLLEK